MLTVTTLLAAAVDDEQTNAHKTETFELQKSKLIKLRVDFSFWLFHWRATHTYTHTYPQTPHARWNSFVRIVSTYLNLTQFFFFTFVLSHPQVATDMQPSLFKWKRQKGKVVGAIQFSVFFFVLLLLRLLRLVFSSSSRLLRAKNTSLVFEVRKEYTHLMY